MERRFPIRWILVAAAAVTAIVGVPLGLSLSEHGIRHCRPRFEYHMSTILNVSHYICEQRGSYPASIAVMVNAKDLNGLPLIGSLDEIPKDPWGRAYEYRLVNGKPWVRCLGRDGLPGGDGDDRDIIRTLNAD